MGGERMLDVNTAAKRIGTRRQHVYILIDMGALAAVNIGKPDAKRKTWRIPESALLEFMKTREAGGMQTRG